MRPLFLIQVPQMLDGFLNRTELSYYFEFIIDERCIITFLIQRRSKMAEGFGVKSKEAFEPINRRGLIYQACECVLNYFAFISRESKKFYSPSQEQWFLPRAFSKHSRPSLNDRYASPRVPRISVYANLVNS
jgi:hypothetical protein